MAKMLLITCAAEIYREMEEMGKISYVPYIRFRMRYQNSQSHIDQMKSGLSVQISQLMDSIFANDGGCSQPSMW